MGKIVSLEPVKTVQVKGQDRKLLSFSVVRNLHVVCGGKYAEQLEEYVEREQPLICLIRFAKIGFYRGEVQITNAFDASIVYLDPTMEEALQFKEKLLEDELPLAVIEKKWVKERFKLHLIVRDDTETCKLILLNTVAKTIVGHDVVDLWDGSYDETHLEFSRSGLEIKFYNRIPVGASLNDWRIIFFHVFWKCAHVGRKQSECITPFPKRKEEDVDLPDTSST
ncbi:hypothetical protein DY000_02002858 [Brassica cretica]|uniref:DUF4283 domain-containing protein n=1 Tax=Brassica cretica TaxID=69181 RepID=A0ABQ7C9B5_BRACR|nr:hypothetical protein DY000_02002858 [Brassica cretica]